MKKKGIIVGCDQQQEWLLSWWWNNYIQENTLPVTFFDFGMSKSAQQWCQKRGDFISLIARDPLSKPLTDVSVDMQERWNHLQLPGLWDSRRSWFKKPFAALNTPYDHTVWLDLDCEVLGSLNPLFKGLNSGIEISLCPEPEASQKILNAQSLALPEETIYNSGVIAFQKNLSLVDEWAKRSLDESHLFLGDQNILSRIIYEKSYRIHSLPDIYNWRPINGFHPQAVIVHWVNWGKQLIKKSGGMRPLIEKAQLDTISSTPFTS